VYQCNCCKQQVSLTNSTLFAQTKSPLRTWLLAIYLPTQHKNGISALALRWQLGAPYNTAWLLKTKLMQAMVERDSEQILGGIVIMDDAYWDGERHGDGMGRSSPGKTPFVAGVQCTAERHPIAMRMDEVAGFRKKALAAWAKRHLALGTAVVTDGLTCFPDVTEADCTHTAIPPAAASPIWSIPFSHGSTRCRATSRIRGRAPSMRCVRSTCSAIYPSSTIHSIAAST
jgi:hypothetical protein